jgi:hypothetical protein
MRARALTSASVAATGASCTVAASTGAHLLGAANTPVSSRTFAVDSSGDVVWTTLVTIGLAISIKIAGLEGTLRGLSNGGKSMIMITSGPFIFIYELIQTPFGYKWKPVINLGLPKTSRNSTSSDGFEATDQPGWAIWNRPGAGERAQQVLENVQNPQLRLRNRPNRWAPLNPQQEAEWLALRQQVQPRRGGKLTYKKKTRKNKKRKTKKLKVKNKRRHTRNKNGGRTKRR